MNSLAFWIVCGGAVIVALLFAPPPVPSSAATSGNVTYSYDSGGRVVRDANSSGNSGAYSYDPAGNRTTSTLN